MNVLSYITDSFQRGFPLAPKRIRTYVADAFGKQISSSWTWRFVKHYEEALQRAAVYPQEDARMEVSKEIARSHIRNLERYVKDVSTELIINIDEVVVKNDLIGRSVMWSFLIKRDLAGLSALCPAKKNASPASQPF
jgi:hypothetical protein